MGENSRCRRALREATCRTTSEGLSHCRDTERKKASRRSEMQEKVRKQAAHDLMQKRGGWFADFGHYMEAAMNGVARTVDASMDEFDEAPRVLTNPGGVGWGAHMRACLRLTAPPPLPPPPRHSKSHPLK